jgi:hypothetical protein
LRRVFALQAILDGVVVFAEVTYMTSGHRAGLDLAASVIFAALALISYWASTSWTRPDERSAALAASLVIVNSALFGVYGAAELRQGPLVGIALACAVPAVFACLGLMERHKGTQPRP